MAIQEIKRTKPAEINQELFDKVFGKDAVKSEEEFNNKIKETIAENYNRETENLLSRDIQNHLVEKTKKHYAEGQTFSKREPDMISIYLDQYNYNRNRGVHQSPW